jgi:hypothetical protein
MICPKCGPDTVFLYPRVSEYKTEGTLWMNPKIERIEEAEAAIETVIAEKEVLRDSALQDGIIDATEQIDLDRLDGKIKKLRDVVRTLRATVENNRRIWDAQAPSLAEWTEQLVALHEAGKPNLGAFDTAKTEMNEAVDDQRWEDATQALNATITVMTPVYAELLVEAAALVGAGAPVMPPPVPGSNPGQNQWDSALAAYTDALAALERHAKAAHPHIVGLITTIKGNATAANALASAGKLSDGVNALRANIDVCAKAEDAAHDVAHYDSTHGHRQGLVATNAGTPVTDPMIDDLQTEMETILADAEADAAAGKHKDAIPKLNRIPPIFDRRRGLLDKRTAYTNWNGATQGLVTWIDGTAVEDRAPIQARIDRGKADLASAQIGVTKDYSVSAGLLRRLNGEFSLLRNMARESATYTSELANFDTEMALIDPHAGRLAIEEFYQAKVVDRAQAVSDFAVANLNAAIVRLRSTTTAKWTAQKANAAAYVIYLTNRQTAQTQIDTVRAMPDTADLIAQADELLATAATQAIAKNIPAAENSVAEALVRATDAQNASQAQTALGALRNDAALDAVDADFPAALDVYTNMRANVVGQDATGTFAAAIAKADVLVDAAKASVDGGSPDMAAVRSNLDAGIAVLEAVLPQILAHGFYQAHLATAKTLVGSTLPLLSTDDCIKPAIDACTALLIEAEALAKDPKFDFVGAEAKLAEAVERGRKAQANATLYSGSILPGKNNMSAALVTIGACTPSVAGRLAASVTRLNSLLSDITTAIAAEDFPLAAVNGTEGSGLAATTAQDVTLCQSIDTDYTNLVTNHIAKVQGGQPEVANALARANTKIAEFNTSMAAGTYRLAIRLIKEIHWAILDGARNLAAATLYTPAQTSTRAKLDAVVAVRNPGIEERLTALEGRYTAAVALAAEPQYATATTRMTEIATEADALLPIALAFGTYETARTAADAKLVEAEGHAQLDAIRSVVTLLRAKYADAVQLASDDEPARAQTLLEEVLTGAEDCVDNADSAAILEGVNDAIGGSASDTGGPTFVHIAAARAAHLWQASKDNATVASAELAEADTRLSLADNDATAPANQTIALREAMDLTTKAGQIISQHSLLTQAIVDARAQVTTLQSHPQSAYLNTQLSDMTKGISAVEAKATNLAALSGCSTDLEAIMAGAVDFRTKLDAHAEYGPLRASPEVEPRLAILEAHTHSFAVQSSIETMRSKLLNATRLSENFDPVAAVALLQEVKTIGLSAFVLAEMQANTPPSKADVEMILARPGGDAELDAMVDALEPDAQRAVLTVAFEARFGCDLQSINEGAATALAGGQPGPNIRRFYQIMSDLPPTATVDNDSLRVFQELENATGASDYTGGGQKRISMRAGDAELSIAQNLGAEHEVGTVEENCEPANSDPVNKFSWSTLHEVGHAVDDQHGFMDKRAGSADFGGWTVYGGNIDPIATIVAAHFDFDKTYIQQVMSGRLAVVNALGVVTTAADIPPGLPAPQGCGAEEWEGRRVAFATWVAQVRKAQSPWGKQSTAQRIAIGGIVYQESYDTKWTSYPLTARSRGITSYQFRAPGEWFSELYAAYHSGKLKDTHPAAGWLADLDGPDA